ncbi:MFS transporter [Pseudoxanthomonas winnipegensis]|uniref:MFS transporter n=1 Tax=Pseudoxanthomonas winnipegensis TaxID=2480810 RepID=UPI0030F4141B
MSTIAARLERLPFSRFHLRLLLIGGSGYLFDAMDVAILAFLMPQLKTLWGLSSEQLGLIGASTAIGGLFGAMVAGRLADTLGRRAVMMWALAIYCLATVASAFAQDWRVFLVFRIVAGLGTSAESVVIAPFLAEFAGARFRGRFTGALTGFFSFGYIAAALLAQFIPLMGSEGWRWILVITSTPILLLLWWRRRLPESPRWLVSKGRDAEAAAIVDAIEAEVRLQHPTLPAAVDVPVEPSTAARSGGYGDLFSRAYVRSTLVVLTVWFSIGFTYYAYFTWLPSLLVASGQDLKRSFAFSLLIYAAQVPGYFSAAYFNDRFGRRSVVSTYLGLAACMALVMAVGSVEWQIIAAAAFLSLFMNGAYAGLYAYTPEVFPTRIRATGQGLAIAVSRVGAAISPIVVGFVYPLGGFAVVFGLSTAVLAVGALAIGLYGVQTRGRTLESLY